jgi:hypothetical protein
MPLARRAGVVAVAVCVASTRRVVVVVAARGKQQRL